MQKLAYFSVLLLIILECQGSLANLQDNGSSICQLQDPQNQCGTFCFSKLHPMIDLIPETNFKLERIHGEQQSIQMKLLAVQSTVEAQRITMQNSLRDITSKEVFNETREQLMAVNSELKSQLKDLQTQMEDLQVAMKTQLDAQKRLEDQNTYLRESLNNTIISQLLAFQAKMDRKIIHPKFKLIGSRYFYIGQDKKLSLSEAADSCRQIGGFLAAFETEEELTAVQAKLTMHNWWYWTGINDLEADNQYISTASGKPVGVFKRQKEDTDDGKACVLVDFEVMIDYHCDLDAYFICQADDEI